MTTTIAFTGHRPQDLGGLGYREFAATLDALGVPARTDLHFVVGGALGTDSFAAAYALLHDIPYTLVLPFTADVMSSKWRQAQYDALQTQINCAEQVIIINPDGYDVRSYQKRNEAMVGLADVVFAVWTGKKFGGTANCIRYALKVEVPVYNMFPLQGKLRLVKEV